MKKKLCSILLGLMLIVGIFGLVACDEIEKNDTNIKNLTFTFIVDDTTYQTIKTDDTNEITIPNEPTKDGYDFDGWYLDNEIWEKPFTINTVLDTSITNKFSIYAKWKVHEHKFESNITYDEIYHWYKSICGHIDVVKDKEEHNYNGGDVCVVCGYNKATGETEHIHIFSDILIYDDTHHWYPATCEHTEEIKGITAHSFGEWKTLEESTCTKQGKKQRLCECGKIEEALLPLSMEHTFSNTYTYNDTHHWYPATCEHTSETKDYAQHNYLNYVFNNDATYEQDGTETGTCICGKTDTRTKENSRLSHSGVTFKTLTLGSNNEVYGVVANGTESFNFNNEIETSGTATFGVYLDEYCSQAVKTKIYPLNIGDNVFYIYVENTDKGDIVYNVTIRVKPLYKVTFNTLNGTAIVSQNIEEGNTVNMPLNDPIKTGYIFKGWAFDFSTPITSDLTINVNTWQAITYKVKYDGNGATNGEMQEETYTYDQIQMLATNVFEKTGYTFNGWSCNGTEYTDGQSVKNLSIDNNAEITLVAQWKAIQYTVSFSSGVGYTITAKKNGNNFSSGNNVTIEDTVVFTLTNRTGYHLDENSVLVASGDKRVFENNRLSAVREDVLITLQGNVTANTYKVKFDGNGATSGEMQEQIFTYGQYQYLRTNTFEKNGYTFTGWKNKDSETNVLNNQNFTNYVAENNSEVVLIAQWQVNQYTINFASGVGYTIFAEKNGSNFTSGSKVTIEDTIAFTFQAREGYHLEEKNILTASGSKRTLTNNTLSRVYENIIISGSASINTYKVKYDGNGATIGQMNDQQFTFNQEMNLATNTFEKTGYTFTGWKLKDTTTTFSNNQSVINLTMQNNEEITLVAIWQINQYKVSIFSGAGGTISLNVANGVKHDYGTEITYNYISTNLGYNYLGLYDGEELITADSTYTFNLPAKEINYTLRFEKKEEMSDFDFISTTTTCKITGANPELISIIIPNYVTEIDKEAFFYRTNLTSVVMGDNVTTIGPKAFYGCTNLTSLELGDKIEFIADYAFQGCESLICKLELPSSVKFVGNYAFLGCHLLSVFIPKSVITIGQNAFPLTKIYCEVDSKPNGWDNRSIDDITNPYLIVWGIKKFISDENGVKYLLTKDDELMAYGYNGSLTEIEIPAKYQNYEVISVEPGAFYNCNNMTNIVVSSSIKVENNAFIFCNSLQSLTLPFSETTVLSRLFGVSNYQEEYMPSSLRQVIINDGEHIGNEAFFRCVWLTSITIGDSIKAIDGIRVFQDCRNLESVYYNGTIDQWAMIEFGNSDSNPLSCAKHLYLLNKSTNDYEEVTEVTLTTATKISSYAFYNCDSLTSVTIPDSVTSIGYSTFSNCISLEEVYYDGTIDQWAIIDFNSNPLSYAKHLYLLNKETNEYDEIKEINITTATKISDSAFSGLIGLTTIEISESVTSIGVKAFFNCSSLTSVIISANVESIGNNAFYGCYKLVEIINKSTLTITKGSEENGYVGYYAKQIITDKSQSNIIENDDFIFYKEGETYYLMGYKGTETDIILPSFINGKTYSVYSYAFYNCSNLTSVRIVYTVKSIGKQAFQNCDSLTNIVFDETSSWYATESEIDWKNKANGVQVNVKDSSANATDLKSFEVRKYYLYKK